MTTKKIGDFETVDFGIENSQYFQGIGTADSSVYTECAYGIGDNPREALDDLLESIAQSDFDVSDLEARILADMNLTEFPTTPSVAAQAEESGDDEDSGDNDCYYHFGLRWNVDSSAERWERIDKLRKLHGLQVGEFSNYRDEKLCDVSHVCYGDVHSNRTQPKNPDDFVEGVDYAVELPYCSGSDYSGSTVELSNHAALAEEFDSSEWLKKSTGGHGTFALFIDVRAFLADRSDAPDTLLERIEALYDYPVVDEELMSNKESELADEEWDNWAESDFRRELEKSLQVDIEIGEESEPNSAAAFRQLFETAREEANVYWYCEGSGASSMYVDISKVVEKVDRADLERLQFVAEQSAAE